MLSVPNGAHTRIKQPHKNVLLILVFNGLEGIVVSYTPFQTSASSSLLHQIVSSLLSSLQLLFLQPLVQTNTTAFIISIIIIINMEALLQQSRSMCPFLKKTSSTTMRMLSTSRASPKGGMMSNLQVLARRCPVMGKAMAVQSSRSAMAGGVAVAMRTYHSKANLHTTAPQQARPAEYTHVKEDGEFC